ncbi:putative acyl-CoA dehydrogenase IBR3 [Vitis vinifera]|uniref:Putative acyl-CoA dehydrogenase IBR3 n=1 Tax=Vitis vinifera TaxID=29760 RepID=A0A438IQT8_VITVI|nr:putative acyl-CoA dehydrogenase IBR3 [Vitis vinifera]
MASRTSDLLGRVHPAHAFDFEALFRYSCANVDGFPVSSSSFTISQFGHGQSNPTFLMEVGEGGSLKRYVVRKKPPGKLLQSAHAVEREFQVLRALGLHTQVPVPKVFCLCIDTSVIGTAFYIMEYLEGRIFLDPKLPGITPNRRAAIYRAIAKALAALHSADVDSIGLEKYGHRDSYCKRQIERWAKQYIASTGEGRPVGNPKMFELIDWLRQHIPLEDSRAVTTGLVHGDFRIDNLVFHPIEDRVVGILDWELSTLGNQMCDVANICLPYIKDLRPDRLDEGFEVTGIPEGIPSQSEYLAEYCSAAGKPWPGTAWKFYIAFNMFRGASILAGVYSRWIMGNASGGERAKHTGRVANSLIDTAWAVIEQKSLLPEHPPSDVFAQPAQCADGRRIHYPLKMDWVTKGRVILLEFNPAKSPYKNLKVEPIFDVVNVWSACSLLVQCVSLKHLLILLTLKHVNELTCQFHGPKAQDWGETEDQSLSNSRGKFVPRKKVLELRSRLIKFMEDHIYPMENEFSKLANSTLRWTVHPEEEKLKELAKKEGLWNLWVPADSAARARNLISVGRILSDDASNLLGAGLSNLEYGYLCEIMGRSVWAPQVFNCGAPDTGNMEVLLRYGNKEQLHEWLIPLLEGKIRSGFSMTEPQVASSDATNIECSIRRHVGTPSVYKASLGDSYIINGKKWWTSGAMDPRCKLLIVMGKTDFTAPIHKQQSMILVDIQTPGIHIKRPLTVFGFDDAPHGHAEISFENVRVPATNILLGEGRGFEIAQGRLGPGRLHHCMRLIGAAERGMQLMVQRALKRRVFGKLIAEQGSFLSDVAKCRVELEQTKLLVLEAADQLDRLGNKKARGTIAMAKVAAPNMALKVLDMAMQVHGAAGLSSDTVLAHLWATARTLRIADGPDEVHLGTIAKLELQRAKL